MPKQIAAFGERQFQEIDADLVEVLRVKASTMRKHFRALKGIAYLVAVVSADRVRVYLFAVNGLLLGGENITYDVYSKVRLASRLLSKFEKPHEPTMEELRMEATEELRNQLSKAIRRVSRLLATSEPKFPHVYVTKQSLSPQTQSWGMRVEADGAIVFDEDAVRAEWSEGMSLRTSFLLVVGARQTESAFAQFVANSIAYSLLREPQKSRWLEVWKRHSKNDATSIRLVNHFVRNASAYERSGFALLQDLVSQAPASIETDSWLTALRVVHENTEVALGTEDFQVIKSFCATLSSTTRLAEKGQSVVSIHLAPRAICNTTVIGVNLGVNLTHGNDSRPDEWLRVEYMAESQIRCLTVEPSGGSNLISYEYGLNIEDAIPKSGGLLSQGRDILRWALDSLGIARDVEPSFSAKLSFSEDGQVTADQRAVLERLSEGKLAILTDTLVGSPERMQALHDRGHLLLIPDFNHVGLRPNLLLLGQESVLRSIVRQSTLEWTLLSSKDAGSVAIVSAPSTWEYETVRNASKMGVSVYPILSASSSRGLLRCEELLPESGAHLLWGA